MNRKKGSPVKILRQGQKDRESDKELTGLFFGSFNPVHLGHIRLADYIYEHTPLKELWYVVSPRNPLKAAEGLLDEELRKKMIELAIPDKPYLRVCDVEFSMPKPSYTIDTLQRLKADFPQKRFVLLMGSDNLQIFDQWKDYKQIMNLFQVWVYPRKAYDYTGYLEKFPSIKVLSNTPFFEISSTEIRERIQKMQDTSDWLHPAVFQFIADNNLYK